MAAKKQGRKKARTEAEKAAAVKKPAAKSAGKKSHAKKRTKKQPWGTLRAKRLAKHPKREPGPKKEGWGALAKKKAELAKLKKQVVTAKAIRSGSGKSELIVPGAGVVSARAREITARHGNKGHTPVSVLLRRIKLLELDILKAVKRGEVDSEEPYVSKHDPAEIKAFLKS